MKRILIILLGLLMPIMVYAQDTPAEFANRHNYIFQHLNRSEASTGILLDYGVEFQNLDNFTGANLLDSNYTSISDWRSIYASLLISQYNNLISFKSPAILNAKIDSYVADSLPLPFVLLHYNYNILRNDALSTGLFTANNDQLYDVPGRPQSPYLQKTTFAIAPAQNYIKAINGYAQFIFRDSLLFGNSGKTISQIKVNFGDGNGLQTVNLNNVKATTYTSGGYKDIVYEITYTDSSIYTGHSRLYVEYIAEEESPGGGKKGMAYRFINDVRINASTAGGTKYATLQIALSQQNISNKIAKPLIVVEGIDFWRILTPNRPWENTTLNNYVGADGILRQNLLFPSGNLETQLDLAGYDIVYVDFDEATDNLRFNTELVKAAINWVNTNKSGSEPNVVMGISMGAVLARSALRQMELASVVHNTRLYVSVDGPHQGANIPLGLQAMVVHLANADINIPFIGLSIFKFANMFPEISTAEKILSSPAADQLLKYRYISNGNISTGVHDNFFADYQSEGYPTLCRNIAISNGSECGTLQPYSPNAVIFSRNESTKIPYVFDVATSWIQGLGVITNRPLLGLYAPLSLLSTKTSFEVEFEVRALPNQSSARIYKGRIGIKRKVLGLFNVNANIINRSVYSNSSILPYDTAPGGEMSFTNNTIGIPPDMANQFQIPSFSFIPTVSALDIGGASSAINYARLNSGYNRDSPPASPYNSPFANFITTVNGNEDHVTFTSRNGDFILKELAGTTTGFVSCAIFCNPTSVISGPSYICTTPETYSIPNLPTGATVTWSIAPIGIATLTTSGNSATFTKVGNTDNATITAVVNSACGSFTVTKNNIAIGIPSTPGLAGIGPLTVGANTTITFDVPDDGTMEWAFEGNSSNYTYTISPNGYTCHFTPTALGTYTVKVRSSYSYGCGYTAYANAVVNCVVYKPNLVIESANMSVSGSNMAISYSVANTGIASAGSFSVGYYLSEDGLFDAGDTYLGYTSFGPLGVGASAPGSETFPAPSTPMYVLIVADAFGAVDEIHEGDNVWMISDLAIQRMAAGNDDRFSYYPNPASTKLKIAYKEKAVATSGFSVKLLNERGKTLKQAKTNNKEILLQVEDVPNGTYYLHIYEGKNVSKQQVIIAH